MIVPGGLHQEHHLTGTHFMQSRPRESLFTNPIYIALQLGDLISNLGDQVGSIALYWLVMITTHSSLNMGNIALLLGVPGVLSGLLFGEVLDRWPKKTAVLLANVTLGVVFGVLALVAHLGMAFPWIYLLIPIAGLFVPLTTIGSFVIIPDVVSSDNLFQANVLNEIAIHVPVIIGPLIAGVLIAAGGTSIALFIDAASFWLAAVVLVPVIRSPKISSKNCRPPESIGIYASLLQSLHYVVGTPTVLWITCAAFAMNVAAGWLEISLPLMVHRQLHETATFLGALWATYAIGTILGGFLSSLLRLQVRKSRMIAMMVVWGIFLMGAAVVGTSWSILIGMGLAGFVFGPYPPMARTIMQTRVASEIRGRIFSMRSAFLGLGIPAGAFIAGLLNSIASPEVGLTVIGTGIILLGASMLLMFRAVPEQPGDVPANPLQ